MIRAIHIKNVQSHKDTYLELVNGLNIIVGNSDSGKSAIIRALRWVMWNRPIGDGIRSHWGGVTEVEIITDEGSVIRRKDRQDEYILKIPGKKDAEFKAIGTSVPEEIRAFLNINEINLQLQLDRPFLLDDSAGSVASHFNRIANIDEIDIGTTNVNSAISKLKSSIEHDQASLDSQRESLKKFDKLEKLEIELEVLEENYQTFKNLLNRQSKLKTLIGQIEQVNTNIETIQQDLLIERPLVKLLLYYDKKETIQTQSGQLQQLINTYQKNQKQIRLLTQTIKLESQISKILSLYGEKETAENHLKTLNKLLSLIRNIKGQIKISNTHFNMLVDKFNKEFPDVCPLCGSAVPHDH